MNETIGYFKRKELSLQHGINNASTITPLKIEYGDRDTIENSDDVVQPISAAMIFTPQKILTIEKFPDNISLESPELGKVITYIGGHVDAEDETGNNIQTFRNTVLREVLEETEIALNQTDLITQDPIIIYAPSEPKTAKHFVALWPAFIPREIKVEDGDARKVWTYRDKSEIADIPNLTEWSEVLVDFLSAKTKHDEEYYNKLRELIINKRQKVLSTKATHL